MKQTLNQDICTRDDSTTQAELLNYSFSLRGPFMELSESTGPTLRLSARKPVSSVIVQHFKQHSRIYVFY